MTDILSRSLAQHAEALSKKEYSSYELTQAFLDRIEAYDSKINAYISVCAEKALADAERADAMLSHGNAHSPLLGIPFAAKDNICTKDIRTTAASRMLENYISPYDATVISRLYSSGAIMLGKTNLDEFAMGSLCENSIFGSTKNPLDPSLSAGGSSGGSAAAVAAHEAVFALGSDTGGSVRLPASFCGLVGICPTYGRVSRYGLIAHASSLDRIGILTNSVKDNALVLSAISGSDELDATCNSAAFCAEATPSEAKTLRVGIISELMGGEISSAVRESVLSAADALRHMGATVQNISLQSITQALAAYYVISSAEASSNLARYDGVRFGLRADKYDDTDTLFSASRSQGFGDEVKKRIILGTFALSDGFSEKYYKRACSVREHLIAELLQCFEKFDILISPTAPRTAFKLEKKQLAPTEIYANDICTVPSSLAGLPALSLPYGADALGRKCGIQLIANHFREDILYHTGLLLEKSEAEK